MTFLLRGLLLCALRLRHVATLVTDSPSEDDGTIPRRIFVTYPGAEESEQVKELARNLHEVGGLPTYAIHTVNDRNMALTVCKISWELEKFNISGAWDAFQALRPGAYKADLWRYMMLWYHGGAYMDMDLRVNKSLDAWVPFHLRRLVLMGDRWDGYWNAFMAAPRGNTALLAIIQHVIDNVKARDHGWNALSVTGPRAVYDAVEAMKHKKEYVKVKFHLSEKSRCGMAKSLPAPYCGPRVYDDEGDIVMYTDGGSKEVLHDPELYYGHLWKTGRSFCTKDDPCEDIGVTCAADDLETRHRTHGGRSRKSERSKRSSPTTADDTERRHRTHRSKSRKSERSSPTTADDMERRHRTHRSKSQKSERSRRSSPTTADDPERRHRTHRSKSRKSERSKIRSANKRSRRSDAL